MMEKVAQINRFHVEQFAYFVNKLKSTKDGDGTLLDHMMVVYGSGLADGNKHEHNDLPVVLLARQWDAPARAARALSAETPMANLYVALLDRMGVRRSTLAIARVNCSI